MHRTEGEDYVLVGGKRLYQPANPPINAATRLPAEAMNAIQEEICKVIEMAGMTLAVGASSDTWGQLWEALTAHKIVGSDGLTDNQVVKSFVGQEDLNADYLQTTGMYYIENPASNFPEIEEVAYVYSGWLHVQQAIDTDDLPYISQTMYITKRTLSGGADFHCQNVYTRRYQKINSTHAWGGWVRINSFQPVRVSGLLDWNTVHNPGVYAANDYTNGPVADGQELTVMVIGTADCITQLATVKYDSSTYVATNTLYIRHVYFTTGGMVATSWSKLFTDADVIPEANIDTVFAKRPDGTTVFELTGVSTLAPDGNTTYFMADGAVVSITDITGMAVGESVWFQASDPMSRGVCRVNFSDARGSATSSYVKGYIASDVMIPGKVSGLQLTKVTTGLVYVGGMIGLH